MFQNDLSVTSNKKEQELRDESESKGYESYVREKSFSVSYSKDYKASETAVGEVLNQVLLERPAASYSYAESEVGPPPVRIPPILTGLSWNISWVRLPCSGKNLSRAFPSLTMLSARLWLPRSLSLAPDLRRDSV